MPLYLDTTGLASCGIALCDRCGKKFPIGELRPDGNSPGLRVCKDDWDHLDPYRLPARPTENINLPFVRPDVPLTFEPPFVPDFLEPPVPAAIVLTDDSGATVLTDDSGGFILVAQ